MTLDEELKQFRNKDKIYKGGQNFALKTKTIKGFYINKTDI